MNVRQSEIRTRRGMASEAEASNMDHKYDDSKSKYSCKEEAKDDAYDSKSYSKTDYKEMQGYSNMDPGSDVFKKYNKKKNKRRSKKDQEGRNFRCEHCDKTYLSYPALYTHKKLKHPDKTGGESTPVRRIVKPTKPYDPEKNPTSLEYFTTPDKAGGPIDPLTYFYHVVKEDLEMEPKYFRLYSFLKVFSILDGFAEEDPETLIPKRDYDELTAQDREKSMSCDEVFALYLREVSRIVNPVAYKKVLKFIFLYRECINEYGWEKKVFYEEKDKTVEDLKLMSNYREYSICNNAEHLPEVANELITEIVDSRGRNFGLSRDECIDLARNFTHWLYVNGFTCSKLSVKPAQINSN